MNPFQTYYQKIFFAGKSGLFSPILYFTFLLVLRMVFIFNTQFLKNYHWKSTALKHFPPYEGLFYQTHYLTPMERKSVVLFVIYELIVIFFLLISIEKSDQRFLHIKPSEWTIWFLVFMILPFIWSKLNELQLPFLGGTAKISFQKIQEQIKEERERVGQVTASQESTVLSLASLVITNPLDIPSYKKYVDDRAKKTIIIGCQDYTEQRLLCAIISKLLEYDADNRFNVISKYDFGGATLNFVALSRGDIDIYPAYTWQGFEMAFATSLPQSAHQFDHLSPEDAVSTLNEIYNGLRHPISWICPVGFYNNWEIVIRAEDADKKNISTITDLKKLGELTLGCEADFFSRPNGFKVLKARGNLGYGLPFKETKFYRHPGVYKALDNEEVNVIDGFSTDLQMDMPQYRRLVDDKSLFGKYHAGILARKEVLDYWDIEEILTRLHGKINVDEIRQMTEEANRVTDKEAHIDRVEKLATEFLQRNGFFA